MKGIAFTICLMVLALPLYAASRFWVGGTGTWDGSDTTHWAAGSNGAGGQSVPGTNDTVTFDGSSGGGTVTVNTNATINSLTMGAFTGTLDFSVNNNNATFSGSGFSITGSGTRALKLGGGTFTFTATNPVFDITTATNLTFDGGSATLSFTNTNSAFTRSIILGGKTISTATFAANSGIGVFQISGAGTISTLLVNGNNVVTFTNSTTTTIGTLTLSGQSASVHSLLTSNVLGAAATVAVTTFTINYAGIRAITFTGSPTANNSFDLGGNSGITINPPGGGQIIGSSIIPSSK